MKCRACGYVSFDDGPCCKRCGADREGRGGAPFPEAPAAAPEPAADPASFADLAAEFASLRLDPEPAPAPAAGDVAPVPAALFAEDEDALVAGVEVAGEEAFPAAEPAFHLDDDIIPPNLVNGRDAPFSGGGAPGERFPAAAAYDDLSPLAADPIIDRDDEIPERFWAPEGAPLGRRILAQAVDQAALLALLALFYGGALLALRVAGYGAERLLTPAGLQAVLPPFALLAFLIGSAYFTFFHGWCGRTPGKLLAGIEVRTAAGEGLSYARALARSLAGLLALGAAGIGLAWAFFEPRRRGWADLASGTVVRSSHPT